MRTALIIGSDPVAAQDVEMRLLAAGYGSIVHVFEVDDAWGAVARKPDLVIVLADHGAPADAASLQAISEEAQAPVLVATSAPASAMHCLGAGAALDGPITLRTQVAA